MKKILAALITLFVFFSTSQYSQAREKDKAQQNHRIEYMNLSWWEKYQDPILSTYLEKLYENNHDLKIATLKVKESEKIVKLSFSQELPQLSIDAKGMRTFKSSDQYMGTLMIPDFKQSNFVLPLTMTYEIDIWGENRLKTKGIEQSLEMIRQDERASYISLSSAFAANYFNLIQTDKLLCIQKELIENQEKIVSMTEKKYNNGLCSINELLDEQKALTILKEEENSLKERQSVLINQLKTFLADKSENIDIERNDFEKVKAPEQIPVNIKTEILENRPDYIRAEHNIKRAGYNVKVAKRDFLPKFLIFGQVGFNAYQWSKIFSSPSQLANIGVMPSVDLFTGMRKINYLKLKKFEYDESFQHYEKTILTSIQEINDSLVSVKTAKRNLEESSNRLSLEEKKHSLVEKKVQIGAASNLNILYSKQQELMTEKSEVSNKINYIISTINLYKATGGKDLTKIEPELI